MGSQLTVVSAQLLMHRNCFRQQRPAFAFHVCFQHTPTVLTSADPCIYPFDIFLSTCRLV